ncbi:MAG: methylmalonyl Co-A mutase-associated GTPase MeaB, partial [Muriicola sp.]
GIKRGIMEMADAIVINKAEGDNIKRAERARVEFERALHLYPPKENNWSPKVLTCSSLTGTGIPEIWEMILEYQTTNKASGYFSGKRKAQNTYWFNQTVERLLKQQFYSREAVLKMIKPLQKEVENNAISPFRAAERLLDLYAKGLK